MPAWLILVHRIPPKPLYLRAKMRQRLAAAGAIPVKKSVYLLPHSDEALEDFQWIAQEILDGGGDAHLIEGAFVDPAANDAAVAQFRDLRNQDYRAVSSEARSLIKGAKARSNDAARAAVHRRLSERLDRIRRLDFFNADARPEAERAVASLAPRSRSGPTEAKRMTSAARLRGRTWVTRPGIKVDRMASAWFIRRFVDPRARFKFETPGSPRRPGDLRFDIVGGDFTHEGNHCTLETLIRRFGLPDRGVGVIAEIVHDLDLKDSKFGHAETAGVAAMIEGLVRQYPADADRLEHGCKLFEQLHGALARGAKRGR